MDADVFDDIMSGFKEATAAVRAGNNQRVRFVPNVPAIRKALGHSQKRFSELLGISLGTLRNWEQGRSTPTGTAITLLRVIEWDAKTVESALAATP